MGSSCNIFLSQDARIQDVTNVIGILLGQKKAKVQFQSGDGWYCDVDSVLTVYPMDSKMGVIVAKKHNENIQLKATYLPDMVSIVIEKNNLDKEHHNGTWFYHTDREDGLIEIIGGASEFWQKLGRGLVEFFGGYVDNNDCDDIDKDFEAVKPRKTNGHYSNADFEAFQEDMWNLQPLTQ